MARTDIAEEVLFQPPRGSVIETSVAGEQVILPAAEEPHLLYDVSKRAIDVLVAGILLVLSLPLLAFASLAIMATTGQAPLLRQRRVGFRGVEFVMLKLRTMRSQEEPPGYLLAKPFRDDRVTPVGRLLRRTSIDELPQLLNVIGGQMTLVGPRPALPIEVAAFPPFWRRRETVRPGLSGLWQVSGRSGLAPRRWMALDRTYLRKRSLWFDLRIIARTVAAVVSMRGAW